MRKMILLIDDDHDEFDILRVAISKTGINAVCVWADGAEAACSFLHTERPDLIMLDYNMPKTDGLRCLPKLQSCKGFKGIPVIFYSNTISETTRAEAAKLGIVRFLQKDGDMKGLVQSMTEILKRL